MHKFYILVLLGSFFTGLNAQTGRISGTILDAKTGETLPGATILIEGTNKGAAADFDGKFSINNVPVGKVNLVISFISYTTKKISNVEVKNNEATDVNVLLEASSSTELQEVEVVVTLNKENNTALVLQQKNATSVSDGVSAETIKRSPDRNTSDVLKRVSGVTIQEDKFVIVRGLNERYNASYLNGAPLPSTEPDRKAFAFNLFPANMLDNIVVYKTATPDMPSEFAGGIVQVNTKSIPEKNFVSVSTGLGYNTVTTGKTKTEYEGGKYDLFGFDDGSRDLPSAIPPTTEKSSWIANDKQAQMAKNFSNDWAFSYGKYNPNLNAQIALGYNIKRKEKDFLGVLFSLAYYNVNNLYTLTRTEYEELAVDGNNLVLKPIEQRYANQVDQTIASTGAMLNLTMKLNENNSINFKNLVSGLSDNKFITANGTNNFNEENVIQDRIHTRYFSANSILTSQINGEHYLPASKLKINWNSGLSRVVRSVPNMRSDAYGKYSFVNPPSDPNEQPNLKDTVYKAYVSTSVGPDYAGYRVYSDLDEKMLGGKLDLSRLVKFTPDLKVDFKIGGLVQNRQREFNIRSFGYDKYSQSSQGIYFSANDSILYLPADQLFAEQNMGVMPNGEGGLKLVEATKNDDNYSATSNLLAGYGMAEFKIREKWRIIGGARYESYAQQVDVAYFKNRDSVYVNNTMNDLLPSLNVVYNFSDKVGLRMAYYKTLNRAEFRELAAANWYDPETRLSIAGNPELERCFIQNADARFEVYPGRGQLFTVTGFYKYFDKPIEKYMYPGNAIQQYYKNANFAHVYGSEMEFRMNIGTVLKKDSVRFLNNLVWFANLALIHSEVNVKGLDEGVPETRPMQGQAPYIINTGLSYIDNEKMFSVTAMLNRVGHRLFIVGSNIIANRWENPRTVVDLQLTKSFLKNKLECRFNIRDLLQQDLVIYYKGSVRESNKYQKEADYVNFVRNYGGTYSFTISYKF